MTPPDAHVPDPVILEKTATHRMVWVDVARVVACMLIIANHMAFYSAELYRWIWAEFLAARTPFFLLVAGYFVGRGAFGPLDGGSLFLWKRSWFLFRPYLVWGLAAAVLIGWSPLHEYYASYQPMYAWLKGEPGSGFWPALAAFGRALGIGRPHVVPAGHHHLYRRGSPPAPVGELPALGGYHHALPELLCPGFGGP